MEAPSDLQEALASSPRAQAAWNDLTPISRRDFVGWINEAKKAETRASRIKRCCENLEAGKRRPCCYAVVPMDLYKALGANPEAKAAWSRLTPSERRDFSEYVEAALNRTVRKERVLGACSMLVAGERSPTQ